MRYNWQQRNIKKRYFYSTLKIDKTPLRYLRLRTSFDSVMISGRKLTFSLSEFPLPPLARTASMVNIRPTTPMLRCWTRFAQSSNMSDVFNFCRKLSPSAFSFCPSRWFSQPLPTNKETVDGILLCWVVKALGSPDRSQERESNQIFWMSYSYLQLSFEHLHRYASTKVTTAHWF